MRGVRFAALASAWMLSAAAATETPDAPAKIRTLLFDDPPAALAMLERDPAIVAAPEYDLFLAFARYRAGGETQKGAASLRRDIDHYVEGSGPETFEFGRILNEHSRRRLVDGEAEDALSAAERAEMSLRGARPEASDAIARAIIWQGLARMGVNPDPKSTKAAYADFSRARALYDTPLGGVPTTAMHAETIAWQAAAAGHFATQTRSAAESEPLGAAFAADECATAWRADAARGVKIDVSWAEHLIPTGSIYGVVIAVDADAEGRPANMSLLADTAYPRSKSHQRQHERNRDRLISRALKVWKADVTAPAECLKAHVLIFAGYQPAKYYGSEGGFYTNPGHHE